MRARSPLYAWMAVVMLLFTAFVAASGWIADRASSVEELHEAAAALTPTFIVAHVAIVAALQWLRRHAATRSAAAPAG